MIITKYITTNYDNVAIDVEFLVIHYSATSLQGIMDIFADAGSKVSSHFVITETGVVYEMVPCSRDRVCRAWHAGESAWQDGISWNNFNNMSIGIELINRNGNIFMYSSTQMLALKRLINQLKNIHKKLRDPRRIIGHEQIAGHRGKVDPGVCFPWQELFKDCYGGFPCPERKSILPACAATSLRTQLQENKLLASQDDHFWQQLNTSIENTVKSMSGHFNQLAWPW